MKKLLLATLLCGIGLNAQVQKGVEFENFTLNNQFDKAEKVLTTTKTLIFAFKKDTGHMLRDFFDSKGKGYLEKNNTMFIADVSAMPSIIRWFVLDDLDKHNYNIVLIEDDDISKRYKNEQEIKKIMVVSLDNLKVTDINYLDDTKDLDKFIESK